MNELTLWLLRTFCILSQGKAESMDLTHAVDLEKEDVRELKCESLWEDSHGRRYRVEESVAAVGYY